LPPAASPPNILPIKDKTEITKRVTDILTDQLVVDPSQVKPETNLVSDLGTDSLDDVELIMAIEEEFNIEIPDDEFEKLKTVADIIGHVEGQLNQAKA